MKKIAVYSLALFLLVMFCLIPTKEDIETKISKENIYNENVVYLLDNDNYLSKVISYFNSNTLEEEIMKKINILIKGDENLPNFHSVINPNTKINSVKVDKENVYIDFSSEIKETNSYLEEYILESIVYTLTEINGINNIYLSVEGKKYNTLFSNSKEIPYPLDRSYGINKEYDINSLDDITKTTIFFNKEIDGYKYYVPVTKINNLKSEKIDIIIEELKSSINSQNNLNSFVSNDLELKSSSVIDDKMNLVFNEYIFNDNEILEEVQYVISKSIFENYDINEVVFNTSETKNIVRIIK